MSIGYPSDCTIVSAAAEISEIFGALADEGALESLADFGRYEGLPPKIALHVDGRTATLIDPISFFRPDGSEWPVPADADLDGASIPRPFWSIIGGPFEGKYRNASIVHDRYCDTMERPWRDTHRMFYDAMRCSGVGAIKARIMFYAVYRFGPRWERALEGAGATTYSPALDDSVAATLVHDAEAIAEHGLDVDEIVALAEAREMLEAGSALESKPASSVADALVIAGGSATADDVATVVAGARKLPDYVVERFLKKKIRLVACCDNVTDFERDLDGVTPRGWERTGRTWNSVPGAYFPSKKRVVIATMNGPRGARIIPDRSTGRHGSDDLLLHEAMHGYDYSRNGMSRRDRTYSDAREADLAGLSEYERQAGRAGLEETFAETGAQHCAVPDRLLQRAPNLATFWQAMPVGSAPAAPPPPMADQREPVGLAIREPDGRIVLNLRATDGDGAIGHAMVEFSQNEPAHEALKRDLFPNGALESTADGDGRRTAPFYG